MAGMNRAYTASTAFIDSAALVSNVSSHTGLRYLTRCLFLNVDAYLVNASMPANATVCEPQILPFGLFPNGTLAPANATVQRLFS